MHSFFNELTRRRVTVVFDPDVLPSLTKQSERDRCDINRIVARYEVSGIVDHVNRRSAEYLDISNPKLFDYHAALDLVMSAEAKFDALPARVRDRFSNDPAKMLEFVADSNNRAEALKLGLLKEQQQPLSIETPIKQPPAATLPAEQTPPDKKPVAS